jgi:hypothetical protein
MGELVSIEFINNIGLLIVQELIEISNQWKKQNSLP